jgi:hypothetical protein
VIETLTVGYVEVGQTQRGGPMYKTKGGDGSWVFCFDKKVGDQVKAAENQTVQVDVDRTPNSQGKVFPTIKSFNGVVGQPGVSVPSSGAAAAPNPPAAAAAAPQPSMKKDPAGIVLGARQTALNAAIAFIGSGNTAAEKYSPADAVKLAKEFAEILLDGLDAAKTIQPAAPKSDDDIPF